MALVFLKTAEPGANLKGESRSKSPASDARVRELLARSVNREAIYGVLLQKQGEPAFGLLPQWLTGYALLFNTPQESERIQKLRTDIGKVHSMYLVYDSSDPLSQAIAERIAVNARDVGILIQPYGEKRLSLSSARTGSADVALVNIGLGSANPMQALAQIADITQLDPTEVVTASTMAQRFAAERSLLANYKVVPIALIPQVYWLNSRVKNWLVSPDGGWRLEQVWMKPEQ